jgi:hypothetical protein
MRRGYQVLVYVAFAATGFWAMFTPRAAQAHVKWFCAYDVAGQPLGLDNVLCPDFEQLVGLSMLLLLCGALIERTALGDALTSALDAATGLVRTHTERIVRVVAGGFFFSLWAWMHVLLTPELKTDLAFVPWLQLIMALSMLSRRTLPIASAGIVLLFTIAVVQYGTFHLMDYPIFLGLAAYLALIGFGKQILNVRPLDWVRWSAAVTLMWASIEKWAYPDWSFPVFVQHPDLSFGLDVGFYMRAAGVVEFALAFALLWTPLVRRVAATILTGIFLSAIIDFGFVDAIGHSCIIAILVAIVADNQPSPAGRRTLVMLPLTYSGTLGLFLLVYYSLHSLIFGTTIG